jgi:xanthosine utilization system XapX-like protein
MRFDLKDIFIVSLIGILTGTTIIKLSRQLLDHLPFVNYSMFLLLMAAVLGIILMISPLRATKKEH